MFNRDVILQISITALSLVIMSSSTLLALGGKTGRDKKTGYHGKNGAAHQSYEKNLNVKNENRKQKGPKKYISANVHHQNTSIKIKKNAVPIKNNIIRYTVRQGDTLTRISKKYNIPVASIRSLNNLENENSIKKGAVLKIPFKQIPSGISKKNIVIIDERKSNHKDKPRFQWPVHHVIDYRNDGLNGVKSIGIIITGKPGSTVVSSAPGTVKKIGSMRGFGKYIVIHHSGRYATVYANLDQITVSEADKIQGGNAIGRINFFDRKLHFQIDLEGKPENPLKYLPKNI